ncbi:uncharacterized protein F4822DRAFT_22206 [Hypoxylon trugodes]|uniref:uncharacterized protein n=1 Tax=Hypoxylon trugodes TaxID=326681 RepID=UPI00219F4A97|nr:uncharacterized protein F4822DRAFT_22206 [Hypoxylon trugodes]KAI1393726.1 hypothetical protein F4822DRAFT_22206 [Hypoxylon trugodes]
MDGRGDMSEAKKLQAEFSRAKAPCSRSRGNNRTNTNNGARGDLQGSRVQRRTVPLPPNQAAQRPPPSCHPPSRMPRWLEANPTPPREQEATLQRPYTSRPATQPIQRSFNSDADRFVYETFNGRNGNSPPVWLRPIPSTQPPQGRGPNLMDSENPPLPHIRVSQRPEQSRPPRATSPEPSLLDEEVEDIEQPVMPFTIDTNTLRGSQEDVTMGGTEADTRNGVHRGGLAASRWNTRETQLDPMSLDGTLEQERRGPSPRSRIVSSGTSRGRGLADSRWASEE